MRKLLNTLYVTRAETYLRREGMDVVVSVEQKDIFRIPIKIRLYHWMVNWTSLSQGPSCKSASGKLLKTAVKGNGGAWLYKA